MALLHQIRTALPLTGKCTFRSRKKDGQNEENYSTINYKYYQDDVDGLKQDQTKDEKVDITTKLSWIAFQDQFFSSVIVYK